MTDTQSTGDDDSKGVGRVPPLNLTFEEVRYLTLLYERSEPPSDAQTPDDPDYELYHGVLEKLKTAEQRARNAE